MNEECIVDFRADGSAKIEAAARQPFDERLSRDLSQLHAGLLREPLPPEIAALTRRLAAAMTAADTLEETS